MANVTELVIKKLTDAGVIEDMTKDEIELEIRKEEFKWLKGSKWYSEVVTDRKYGPVVVGLLKEALDKGLNIEHFGLSNGDLIRAKEYLHRSINNNHKTFTWKRN